MRQGEDEEEEGEKEEEGGEQMLADLLQVLVVLQLVHQLAVQVVADLLRSALRGREGLMPLRAGRWTPSRHYESGHSRRPAVPRRCCCWSRGSS